MKKKVLIASEEALLLRKLRDRGVQREEQEAVKRDAWVKKLIEMAPPSLRDIDASTLADGKDIPPSVLDHIVTKLLEEGV
ncbi:hypothetical protein [Chlamydiifrater phoenicopteri]|uniref:hypothetical protein n=1 Tax=Chlamydiifrater phoenicopteri TaxID=2681469 RepID=UPI001BCE249E|nr:hypothetical protein [Chlamydiifrater phoenicopteri]